MSSNKTPEELRADLYKQMVAQQGSTGEYMCEVAMPGVQRPVDPADIDH